MPWRTVSTGLLRVVRHLQPGDRLTPEEIAALVRQRDRATAHTTARTVVPPRSCSGCTTLNASSAVSEARFRSPSSGEPAGLSAQPPGADAARCEQVRQTLAGLLMQVGPADTKPDL